MDNLKTLQELYRHMEWADASIWTSLLAIPDAAEDTLLKERIYHIHMVQRAFLQVWKGEAFRPRTPDSFSGLAGLLDWAQENYRELNLYVSDLGGMDLERPIVMPWIEMFEARMGRKAEVPSFHETLLQVAMHSTYHRGQVSMKLRELGGEPPLTDFIAWVWRGKPEPLWPSASA